MSSNQKMRRIMMISLRKTLISIIALLLVLNTIGCSFDSRSNNSTEVNINAFNFSGESKHWTATYKQIINNDDTHESKLDIRLKEQNYYSGKIEYTLYKNGDKKTYGTGEASGKIGGTTGGNGAKPQKSDKYILEITWEDGKETFPLDLQE
jgi:hypothetical protein